MIAAYHPAAPDIQDLDHRVQPVLGQGNQVLLAAVCPQGNLSFHQALHIPDLVPDRRGFFKTQRRSRLFHILFQFLQHTVIVPAQETQNTLHHFPVCFLRAFSCAGSQASADVIIHTGPFGRLRRQNLFAGADGKHIPHRFNHLAYRIGADIRSEILCPVHFHYPA